MTETSNHVPNGPRALWRRRFWLGGLAAIGLAAAGAGAIVHAQPWDGARQPGFMMNGGPGGMHGPRGDRAFPPSADRIEERADKILYRVDATPDQKAKIHTIIEQAVKDLEAARPAQRPDPDSMRKLLTAAQIDPAAIEKLRTDRQAAMDQMSRIVTKAFTDAAQVLTPEQRTQLAKMRLGHHGPF